MYRGTTPTIKFTIEGLQEITIQKLYITFEQKKITEITKSLEDIVIEGNEIMVELTQEDTLKFKKGKTLYAQIRMLTESGTAYASKIIELEEIGEILKEGAS